MATGDDGAVAEVLKAVARHVNCLNEGSRASRKRALEAVRRETVDKSLSGAALQRVFSSLLRALLPCLADPMDSCREAAVQLIGDFVRRVPRPEDSLADLMPCLAQRLGSQEAVEPAEELRLALTELLSLTVGLCGKRMAPYLDEVVRILQRTVVDPFPDVKRESCKCAIEFAQSVPEHFHMQAESLVKPLMQTITHQHSRVRVAVIQATGVVVQHGNGRTMDDVLSHLAQRLFDDSPQVRKAVTVVVGDWLLHLKDRYSYFHKLIPLLLSSFSDEIPEIRSLAADLWKQVGAQWEKENEDDLKDKLDFLLTAPPLYPPEVERPGLGCRELVVRNLSRLMPAVSRDMGDWQAGTRLKMAQLLTVLLLHAEDHGTQHLQPLLSTLYHGCTDSVREVHAPCLESAKLLGVFVSPEAFLKLLLEHVENPSTHSASSPWAPLMVLGAVLGGCSRDRLQPHLQPIADTLALPHVCQERQQAEYLQQLLSCVDVLVGVCHHDCGTVSLQLLKVLISVESLANGQPIRDKADECVRALCAVQGVCEVSDLYRLHMPDLLQWLTHTLPSWTSYSIQNTQLQVILLRSGPVVGEFLPLLVPVFQNSLQPDRDPKMKLQLLSTLSELLMDAEHTLDSQRQFGGYAEVFVHDCILPNLVWCAGRTAAAVRTAALSCLLALLTGGALSAKQVLSLENQLSPQLLPALEEDSKMSRLLACQSLTVLLRQTAQNLQPDTLNKIYPELLKRVDDSSDEVRAVALRGLSAWFSGLGNNYDSQNFLPHLEFLFQQLLLYLDDPDSKVQEAVLEVLKTGSVVYPSLLLLEVEAARNKHRSPVYCDDLLEHLKTLS